MSLPFSFSQIIKLDTVESTNNFAANLLKTSKPSNGTVILTECQTKGRGQRSQSWESEPYKNLTFSIILYPEISVKHQFDLTVVVSLSILEFLKSLKVEARIKWPNDIFVGKEKIAGVLIENTVFGSKIKHSILGLGINVNQENFENKIATSILLATNKQWDLKHVFTLFTKYFEQFNTKLILNKRVELWKLYHENLLGINLLRTFKKGNETFNGLIRGVDELGNLKVDVNGELKMFSFKEIQFIHS